MGLGRKLMVGVAAASVLVSSSPVFAKPPKNKPPPEHIQKAGGPKDTKAPTKVERRGAEREKRMEEASEEVRRREGETVEARVNQRNRLIAKAIRVLEEYDKFLKTIKILQEKGLMTPFQADLERNRISLVINALDIELYEAGALRRRFGLCEELKLVFEVCKTLPPAEPWFPQK